MRPDRDTEGRAFPHQHSGKKKNGGGEGPRRHEEPAPPGWANENTSTLPRYRLGRQGYITLCRGPVTVFFYIRYDPLDRARTVVRHYVALPRLRSDITPVPSARTSEVR
jgi:hypothetical protein